MDFLIRTALKDDADSIAGLSGQLGYPISREETLENLSIILQTSNETIFVALHEDKVIGWIGVFKTVHLASGPHCVIGGLVVHDDYHRKGVGKKLVDQALHWSRQQCQHLVRVRCNMKRKEAHGFYVQLGFTEKKEQKVFEINI
jgi:GNAT superfamily N-acetyltransferase